MFDEKTPIAFYCKVETCNRRSDLYVVDTPRKFEAAIVDLLKKGWGVDRTDEDIRYYCPDCRPMNLK